MAVDCGLGGVFSAEREGTGPHSQQVEVLRSRERLNGQMTRLAADYRMLAETLR